MFGFYSTIFWSPTGWQRERREREREIVKDDVTSRDDL